MRLTLKSLIRSLRNTPFARRIRKNRFLKWIIRYSYKTLMFPFTRDGIDIDIGGISDCKLDYHFAFSGYEDFGEGHNSGYREWIERCRGKLTIFDIGAHIGLYTIPASKVLSKGGTIYAFEPSNANVRYLKKHIMYNKISNVKVITSMAGWETKGKQVFYEKRGVDPMNSPEPKKNVSQYNKVFKAQVSLDDFAGIKGIAPEVIKIDVEGYEYDVLKGSGYIMKRHKPVIFLSVHPQQLRLFKSSADEVMKTVTNAGYRAFDLNGRVVEEFKFGEYLLTAVESTGL